MDTILECCIYYLWYYFVKSGYRVAQTGPNFFFFIKNKVMLFVGKYEHLETYKLDK